jgi:hypothetical protein
MGTLVLRGGGIAQASKHILSYIFLYFKSIFFKFYNFLLQINIILDILILKIIFKK